MDGDCGWDSCNYVYIYIYIMYKNDGCLKLDSLSLVF